MTLARQRMIVRINNQERMLARSNARRGSFLGFFRLTIQEMRGSLRRESEVGRCRPANLDLRFFREHL